MDSVCVRKIKPSPPLDGDVLVGYGEVLRLITSDIYTNYRRDCIVKHPPLPMALSSPGTKVPRVPGGKQEEHCGLHVWAQRGLGATGSNPEGGTGKVDGGCQGRGEGNGEEDEIPFWTF